MKQHNDTQYNKTQHYDTQHNETQDYDTLHHNKRYDIQHKITGHYAECCYAFMLCVSLC